MKKNLLLIFGLLFHTLSSVGQYNNWQWAKGATGSGLQEGVAVATDTSGNFYLAGYFGGDSIKFDTITLYNTGQFNLFLTKYSSTGKVLWARAGLTNNMSSGSANSVATDLNGNVYITGYYAGHNVGIAGAVFPTVNVSNTAIFIAKFDSAGNLIWAQTPGANNTIGDQATGITTDKNGSIYLTGWFGSNTITFGNTTPGQHALKIAQCTVT